MRTNLFAILSWLLATPLERPNAVTAADVAIVIGGGPAGLVTTLALSRVCQRVLLVEKHLTFEPLGATIAVQPNGKKALSEICPDLLEDIENLGLNVSATLGSTLLPWWELRDAAVRAVQKRDNVEVFMGETFTSIEDDSNDDDDDNNESKNCVTVTFKSGRILKGDFVVGADGVHSDVRKWLGLPAAVRTGTANFRGHMIVTQECSESLRNLLDGGVVAFFQALDQSSFAVFNYHPNYPNLLAWVVSTRRPVVISSSTVNPTAVLRDARATEEVLSLFEEILSFTTVSTKAEAVRTSIIALSDLEQYGWGGKGRVTLIGDAAHAMQPTNGQGGNQAFEDAVILYRTLLSNGKQNPYGSKIANVLRTFESIRLPRVKLIHETQSSILERRLRGDTDVKKSDEDWILNGV